MHVVSDDLYCYCDECCDDFEESNAYFLKVYARQINMDPNTPKVATRRRPGQKYGVCRLDTCPLRAKRTVPFIAFVHSYGFYICWAVSPLC